MVANADGGAQMEATAAVLAVAMAMVAQVDAATVEVQTGKVPMAAAMAVEATAGAHGVAIGVALQEAAAAVAVATGREQTAVATVVEEVAAPGATEGPRVAAVKRAAIREAVGTEA